MSPLLSHGRAWRVGEYKGETRWKMSLAVPVSCETSSTLNSSRSAIARGVAQNRRCRLLAVKAIVSLLWGRSAQRGIAWWAEHSVPRWPLVGAQVPLAKERSFFELQHAQPVHRIIFNGKKLIIVTLNLL